MTKCRIQKDFGLPPPEMVFGNNYVTVKHNDFKLVFGAYDALALVDTSSTSSEKIKVAYSEEWTRKRFVRFLNYRSILI
jgi:type 2A phosphatase activator TIP41